MKPEALLTLSHIWFIGYCFYKKKYTIKSGFLKVFLAGAAGPARECERPEMGRVDRQNPICRPACFRMSRHLCAVLRLVGCAIERVYQVITRKGLNKSGFETKRIIVGNERVVDVSGQEYRPHPRVDGTK